MRRLQGLMFMYMLPPQEGCKLSHEFISYYAFPLRFLPGIDEEVPFS